MESNINIENKISIPIKPLDIFLLAKHFNKII